MNYLNQAKQKLQAANRRAADIKSAAEIETIAIILAAMQDIINHIEDQKKD